MIISVDTIVSYLSRVCTATSVLLNVLLGGYSNQTFSARNWDLKRRGKPNLVKIIDLFLLSDTHCMDSWTYWAIRKHTE